jgi:hypothetical protein
MPGQSLQSPVLSWGFQGVLKLVAALFFQWWSAWYKLVDEGVV